MNHDHYFVQSEQLFESYRTHRGLRSCFIKPVPGKPDSDNCDEEGNDLGPEIALNKAREILGINVV